MARAAREAAAFWIASTLLALGLALEWSGRDVVVASSPRTLTASALAFLVATAIGLAQSGTTLWSAIRARRASVDVLAFLALVGAVLVGEYLAAAVVAVMIATGRLLDARAQARAQRELTLLVNRAPRTARVRRDGTTLVLPSEDVQVGDVVVVGPGELTPVDGRLLTAGTFDESALTGEPLPVERAADDVVRSGVVNAGSPVDVLATTTAGESTYAGIVRLVDQAVADSAPLVRLADRLAAWFVPLALATGVASWVLSGDPVRAVAVLVIATPCPLLLAAPIAVMGGMSRAARTGVIVKGGAALERLGAGEVLLLDKTGTLTRGRPTVSDVTAADGWDSDEVLRLAASLDQVSPHVLATSVVAAAHERGLALAEPREVREVPGYGIQGFVDGAAVRLGKAAWIVPGLEPAWARQVRRRAWLSGSITVFVSVDDLAVGALVLDDPIRPDAARMVRGLRTAGIRRIVLVSGDRHDVAESVGRLVGVDEVYAEHDPGSKVEVVARESTHGRTIMVGDGVNDAPSLAAASVGVALAARGSSAASEAAEVVLTVDRIDALADAILIARRARRIALASAGTGMALAVVGMGAAALGFLTPTAGAVLQEGIDLLAIGIALTVLIPSATHTVRLPRMDARVAERLRDEHDALAPLVHRLRHEADALGEDTTDIARVRDLVERILEDLLPHERREEQFLVPVVERALGPDPTAALSRTHAEIEHLVTRLDRLVSEIGEGPVTAEDVIHLRGMLYGLHAVMQLHNAHETEAAFSLLSGLDRDVEGAGRH